jgi:2,3-bisphosphoglycerate-independent phosphoglycerate mutase
VRKTPPLVVLVLGGAAERLSSPPRTPLSLASKPNLDRLAAEGRVFGVRLLKDDRLAFGAAPLLAILGFDPEAVETSRASYMGALAGERLLAEECFLSADFLALFRDIVADAEPGPFKPAEAEVLLGAADSAVRRAGFRLTGGSGARHLAVAPRASVDAQAAPPPVLLGRPLVRFEPRVEQHAFAHRLARDALGGHELNEVRRDLGRNGADAVWCWGPGGTAALAARFDAPVSAAGQDPVWRGVCRAAGIPVRGSSLPRAVAQALRGDAVFFVHLDVGPRALRADAIADLDQRVVAPLAKAVASARGRLLVLPDVACDGAGVPVADPVPALLWGEGIEALKRRAFSEAGAAAAGEPLEPGHGLLAYVRHL